MILVEDLNDPLIRLIREKQIKLHAINNNCLALFILKEW